MTQRSITWILLFLLVILQGQLWIGRGSVPEVMQLQQQLNQQLDLNRQAQITNQRFSAELLDLSVKIGLTFYERSV